MKKTMMILLGALCATMAVACDKPATQADPMPPGKMVDKKMDAKVDMKKDGAKADMKKADAKKADMKGEKLNYTIDAKALSLTVGTAGELAIVVKPAPGFKVNEEFPWKAKFSTVEDVKMGSSEVSKDKWTLSKSSAAMKVPVTVNKAGEREIKATLNFSVCDDDACEVIRNKEVTIKVAAK